MTAYLLDSNHASVLITLQHPVRRRIVACIATGDLFHITLPVVTETVFGFGTLPRAVRNAQEWAAFRPALRLLSMDEDDALNAVARQVTLRRQGWQLATVDALIATAALRYNVILLTTAGDFRRVPTLISENWMVP